MCLFVFRCGPLLSADTASASSRNPLCGVFRHVLFPQDKEGYGSFCIARRKLVCIFEESTVLRSKHHVSEGNTRRLLEKENRFYCVRCVSKKLSLSCGKAKTMRPHSERGNCLSKLLCSLAPRKHTAKRY